MLIGSIRRIVGNALSLLTSDVFNRAATFFMYVLVARYLDTFEFGQMSLALTYFYVFQVLAVGGLKTLLTREIARDRTKTEIFLVNGSSLVVVLSLLSMITLFLLVWLMGYTKNTAFIILLLSLGLLPYSLSAICEGVFQAWERMYYIAYASVPANVFKVILAFVLLSQGKGLYHIVLLTLAVHVAVLGVEWWLMGRFITRPRMRLDLRFSLAVTRKTVIFLGIDSTIAIWSSLSIILLSKFAGEVEVGLFSAASQLAVPLALIFQSVVVSIFPIMCRRLDPGYQSLKQISVHLIEFLLAITLPTVVGLFFLAEPALLLLYGGGGFLLASKALQIMVWGLILTALSKSLGQVLLAGLREKVTLRILIINLLASIVFGPILISQFGLIGAAVNTLVVRSINFVQHYVATSAMFPRKIELTNLFWKPVVASTCMAVYLLLIRGHGLILSIIPAGIIYLTVLFVLAVLASGGPRQVKERYLRPYAE